MLFPEQTEILVGCDETVGAELTVNVAVLDVAEGEQVPLIIQRYWYPFKPEVAPVMVIVVVNTPEYGVVLVRLVNPLPVFTCHWYVSDVPAAATENVVLLPEQTDVLAG